MSWFVCIPSHNRSKSINERTLKLLFDCGIPKSKIKVFVAPDEIDRYRGSLDPEVEVIVGALGCIANRNSIIDYYPEGQHIVYMDDDIQQIVSTCDFPTSDDHSLCKRFHKDNFGNEDYVKHRQIGYGLKRFFDSAFEILVKEKLFLGGVNSTANGFFHHHSYRIGLNYICGGLYFEINRKDVRLTGLDQAEDFDRSCMFFKKDGATIRFLFIGLKTQFYNGDGDKKGSSGGLCDTRTLQSEYEAKSACQMKYSDLLDLIPPKPKGKGTQHWNLRCKRWKDNKKIEFV